MNGLFPNPDRVLHYTQSALTTKSYEALPDFHYYVEYLDHEWGFIPLNEANTDMPIVFSSIADLEHGINYNPLLWWLESEPLKIFIMNANQRKLPVFGYCKELVMIGAFNGETWENIEI